MAFPAPEKKDGHKLFLFRRILLALPFAAALVISAAGQSMAAGPLANGPVSSSNSSLTEFPPVRVLSGSIVFRPTGIAATSAQSAYIRLGGRRHSVPVDSIRAALVHEDVVRLTLPRRLLTGTDRPGRGRGRAVAQAAARFRLGVVYSLPVHSESPSAGEPLSVGQRDESERSPGAEPPPVAEPPIVDTPPVVETPPVLEPARAAPPPSYFVSPNGSDGNPGTEAAPFRSLDKAYKSAEPGNSVEVEAGDYSAQQTLEYDPSKAGASEPVTFVTKGHAHFKATEPTSSYWTNVGASHIAFQGDFEFDFVVIRNDEHAMSEITFRETWIHHLSEMGNLNGLFLYNNKMGPNTIWPSTGAALKTNTGPDDILNMGIGKVCPNPTACFAYSAKNVSIVGNAFDGAYHSWSSSHSDCIQYTVGQSGYIAGNTFRNCQDETLILRDNLGGLANITIENNYLGRPTEATDPYAIHMSPCTNCVVRFNSVPSSGSLLYASASVQGTTSGSGDEVYGNIAGHYDGQCEATTAQGWDWDYNLFIGGGGICGTHAATTSNPLYIDLGSLNLAISPGSKAVDFYRGSAPVPTDDIGGTLRPQGEYPDAGAFELKNP